MPDRIIFIIISLGVPRIIAAGELVARFRRSLVHAVVAWCLLFECARVRVCVRVCGGAGRSKLPCRALSSWQSFRCLLWRLPASLWSSVRITAVSELSYHVTVECNRS